MPDSLDERLEMLLVLRWLDRGAPEDGTISVSVDDAAEELGVEGDRPGLLSLMSALGGLEERGAVSVRWPRGAAAEAVVTLSEPLRRDARRLFGRNEPSIEG